MPVLSAGRHRNARKGGCFMEYASYLAGERWSDHPVCTHPDLALLARMVNDCTADQARSRLAEFIPAVIGLGGDDSAVGTAIAIRCAAAALPVASEERQQALAAGLIACQRTGFQSADSADLIRGAFDQAPQAERWARAFLEAHPPTGRAGSLHRMTESIIRTAVLGIAQACVPDPDERLRRVLADAIADCSRLLRPVQALRTPLPSYA